MLKNGTEYIDASGGFKGGLHNGTRTAIYSCPLFYHNDFLDFATTPTISLGILHVSHYLYFKQYRKVDMQAEDKIVLAHMNGVYLTYKTAQL